MARNICYRCSTPGVAPSLFDGPNCPRCNTPVEAVLATANAYRVPRPEDVRGETHGDFFAMSATVQATKNVWRRSVNWDRLHSGQKEALELIATKVGRILTGDPGFKDHWDDGAGYFNKGAEICAAYKENKDVG